MSLKYQNEQIERLINEVNKHAEDLYNYKELINESSGSLKDDVIKKCCTHLFLSVKDLKGFLKE